MNPLVIKYLTCFFENLNDEGFLKILKLIFDKPIICPDYTYKEYALSVFTTANTQKEANNIPDGIKNFKKANENEKIKDKFLNDKKYYDNYVQGKLSCSKQKLHNNLFYKIKQQYEQWLTNTNYNEERFIGYILSKIEMGLSPDEYIKGLLIEYIKPIIEFIDSFIVDINVIQKQKQKDFIRIINFVIDDIANNKSCYVIDDKLIRRIVFNTAVNNKANIITTEEYELKEECGKLYIVLPRNKFIKQQVEYYTTIQPLGKDNVHKRPLLHKAVDYKSFISRLNCLQDAIEKLKTKAEDEACHVCNPITQPKNNAPKCGNCERIYKIIMELKPSMKSNNITGRIKGHIKKGKKLSFEEKIKRNHKNLCSFRDELLNDVTINTTENKSKIDELKTLINDAFSKYDFI